VRMMNMRRHNQMREGSAGLKRTIDGLKGDKGESAFLELEAAYAFGRAGCQVQFPWEGGSKSPDVLVTFGDAIFAIECKRLRSKAWEGWEDSLTSTLINALPWMKGDRQISLQVASDDLC
jgi:hypothetical protein